MQSIAQITQTPFTRQELLWLWLRRNNLTLTGIARDLGVTISTVRLWFDSETIPQWRHESLVNYGVPAELLPEPVNIAPGPKRRQQ